jgi:hypothetical protein
MRKSYATVALMAAAFLLGGLNTAPRAADGSVTTTRTSLTAESNPNFDAVTWRPLGCTESVEPVGDSTPTTTDLAGDATHSATYFAWDSNYLYARFRLTASPTGSKGFDQYAWVMLLQVPSGDPFQYQFELSLNGKSSDDDYGNTSGLKGDTIELWRNDAAENIAFDPNFNDPSETRLYGQRYDYAGPATVNTTPLARIALVNDGTSFGGDPDYFLDYAIPVSILIAKGVVTSAAELSEVVVFPATASNANQYNKDYLACPFLPNTTLSISKSVAPAAVPGNIATPVSHTITVTNTGEAIAKGLWIEDTAFPTSLSGATVTVSSDNPTVTWTVVTANPLQVKVPRLPIGNSMTVRIDSTATLPCGAATVTDTANAHAVNAPKVLAQATLTVAGSTVETCDGLDNNCNGQIDEGVTNCDDGNACNGPEQCVAGACVPGIPPNCSSNNPCIDDSCNPATGCVHANNTNACDDGNACTTNDVCGGGTCHGGPPVSCDDGNPCTDDSCNPASGCVHVNNTHPCDDLNVCTTNDTCSGGTCHGGAPRDCNDNNVCTTDSCDPALGCYYTNNTAPCDDGLSCTTNDTCAGGTCVGGTFATPDCEEPKPVDFYIALCDGTRTDDEITQANVDCVNDWSLFAWVTTVDDVCRVLHQYPNDDKCLEAEAQLMAALLNLCKGRLAMDEPILSTCTDHGTVGLSLIEANALLANPARTADQCATAECETEELNNGNALATTTLRADRTPTGVHIFWLQPPTSPSWATQTSYSVWRRPRGVGAFAIIATVPTLYYDDVILDQSQDYEYGVTVNRQ